MNISKNTETILSQARNSEKVQRLSRKGVGTSVSKLHPSRTDEDIVSSAWQHAAALTSGSDIANHSEDTCYVSDFGAISIVPSRFSRARDAYLIDKELVTLATLRPMQSQELAKTGDATKYMLLVEYGLQVNNEKGLGAVYDLSTS